MRLLLATLLNTHVSHCLCSHSWIAADARCPCSPTAYLVLSQVVMLHEGQLALEPLQFPHLTGKVLLVPFPHGILQEAGAKVEACHPPVTGFQPALGGAARGEMSMTHPLSSGPSGSLL